MFNALMPLFWHQKGQLIRRPDYKICSYSVASAYFKAMFLAFIKAIVSNAYRMSLLCAFFQILLINDYRVTI